MGKVKRLLWAACALLLGIGLFCGTVYLRATRVVSIPLAQTSESHERGELRSVEQVGHFDAWAFRALIWWGGLPEAVSVSSGATLYRVEYWTVRFDGQPTPVSGLVAIPKEGPFRGVVSYQHGTNPDRHASPSRPSLEEGVLASALFAGGGYVLAAPDYVGLGKSREVHTYLHSQSTADAVVDLLRAARKLVESLRGQWPGSVFLMGFSQGGHATLAAQRSLEADSDPAFHVVASAPVSGAYDLLGTSFPTAMNGASSGDALYLAWLAYSYCTVCRQPLESVLSETIAKSVPPLFDGEHDVDSIIKGLPAKPRDLFNRQFLERYDRHERDWFLNALAENGALDWTPRAPVRLYYGEKDEDVSPKEAEAALAAFSRRGCDVTLVSVGQCDHNESIMRSAPRIRAWFDTIAPAVRKAG